MTGGQARRRFAAASVAMGALVAGLIVVQSLVADDTDSAVAASETTTDVRRDQEVVTRRTLEETSEANGRTGFGTARQLNITAEGIVTEAAEPGDILEPGDIAARVGGRPVFVVDGATPMYRELRLVADWERDEAGDKVGQMTGADVRQLQDYLIGLGFDNDDSLEADGVYGSGTEKAVKAWQRSSGLVATGRVDRSQMVFINGAVRVETAPRIGESFLDLTITDLDPVITAAITNQQRSSFAIGNNVEVEFADRTITGTVTDATRTVSPDGSATYQAEITPDPNADIDGIDPDDNPKITARRVVAEQVLTVPVRALIALAEGGWAVEVDGPSGPTLTAIELGKVVNGYAEITGVTEGATVLVVVS